jgi:hypothetical protein
VAVALERLHGRCPAVQGLTEPARNALMAVLSNTTFPEGEVLYAKVRVAVCARVGEHVRVA